MKTPKKATASQKKWSVASSAGPPRADRGPDQQREDADAGEHVVEAADAARDRRQRDLGDAAIAEGEQRVDVARAAGRRLLDRVDVLARLDRLAVDGEHHVAGADAGPGRRRALIDLRGHHAGGPLHPEHPVLDVVAGGPLNDIGEPEQQQRRRHADRQGGAHAQLPLQGGRVERRVWAADIETELRLAHLQSTYHDPETRTGN